MPGAYDLLVIGGGSGGSACARRAAAYGAKVCLVERMWEHDAKGIRHGAGPGGTCVNVGCVPKKLMWMAASQRESMVGPASVTQGFGLKVPPGAGDVFWSTLKKNRDQYVNRLVENYEANWKKEKIELVKGVATFEDAQTVRVKLNAGGEQLIKASKVLVAVGGRPVLPEDVPGIDLAINSDAFFELEQQPKKVAVLGAGYIAVEMAGIFHGLGSETHLFFRGQTVLRRGFDPYIVDALMSELQHHGPQLHASCSPKRLVRDTATGKISLTVMQDGNEETVGGFDAVLSAIGRQPVTATLQLGKAGVDVDEAGLVKVDAFENTSSPSVFALGDCTTSGFELTPVAIAAGRRLADRLFGGEPRARIEYASIATVVFSHPPIGTIGLTEPAARAEFGDAAITVKQAAFSSMAYALNAADAKVKTALKLVLRGPEETVVGLHCIGPFSDEMMQGFAVAVRMGATRADFEASVAIHPTIAEEFVTFGGWGQRTVDGVKKPQLPPYLAPVAPAARGIFCARSAFVGAAAAAAAGALALSLVSRPS